MADQGPDPVGRAVDSLGYDGSACVVVVGWVEVVVCLDDGLELGELLWG